MYPFDPICISALEHSGLSGDKSTSRGPLTLIIVLILPKILLMVASFAEGGEECDTIREDLSGNGSDSLGSTTTGNEDLSEDLRRDAIFLILITFCGW